ncbi:UDP-N-acetylglucosamine--N-acetylmuramyl-(pentapeptide) pyrophosphoryl-undecaprenol N-acetylglucosamine transferase [Candidatus Saccharibacteria bacterium]|nr:UDP-N-acetylglucosamine--N-acetylmuramyl-(pentapeptide) pyrophosphoryl-undecaprenol N-acetylglucosamine transferase [Candidatus Saccharibacteria bacterium]
MKILIVGGGSGGHITPAVAVAREILLQAPRSVLEFWTDGKYYKNVVKLTTELGVSWGGSSKENAGRTGQYIRVRKISAGKFRRYSGWKIADYFSNIGFTLKEIVWGNIKGLFCFVLGLFQTFFRLVRKSSRPDVIFLKGGYVSLPVGLIARLLKIPYVIHESDAAAGLANRLLSKKAAVIALGMEPRELAENMVVTGIPVGEEFAKVSESRQRALKRAAGFNPERPLVMITGGSQGALHIDEAVREILPEMLKFTSVGLVAGRAHYESMVDLKKYEKWDGAKLQSDFRMWEFSTVMNELLGAADVVVSRAGATTIAELSSLKKAVVLVPFEKLPGSHQVKNAERLEAAGAAEVVLDGKMVQQPGVLLQKVQSLVRSPKKRESLAANLHKLARPHAARDLAEIIIGVGKGGKK